MCYHYRSEQHMTLTSIIRPENQTGKTMQQFKVVCILEQQRRQKAKLNRVLFYCNYKS